MEVELQKDLEVVMEVIQQIQELLLQMFQIHQVLQHIELQLKN
jgi:uncharacterized protein YqgV (UPF0045/DUF77 family)